MLKKLLIFFFGINSNVLKYYFFIKKSYSHLKIILPFVKFNKLTFVYLIIKSQYFLQFQLSLKWNNKKKYFEKKYSFNYQDWFSGNINIWYSFLKNLKEIRYLEIGSFEGRSALFIGELSNTKEITCVDTFEGSDEHNRIDFNIVYKNCSQNLKKLKVSKYLVKKKSYNFFVENKKRFNVIYLDGSHYYEDIKSDFINAMNCLQKNGILICDDFLWFYYKKIEYNPILAILECYNKYKKDLKILLIDYQIIFKKIN